MRKPSKKAYAATVAAAAAVALTAGMTSPASAGNGDRGISGTAAGAAGAKGGALHTITLITGDRVLVDGRGRIVSIQRAKGREGITVFTRTHKGQTYVIPRDARSLIAKGTLDRRLFNITELAKPESRKAHRAGLKVIVGYRGATAGTARAGVRATEGTTVRRTLATLGADAVTSATGTTGELWDALTRPDGEGSATTTSGIGRVWLDGVRKASLDRSTAQIGAPAAWARSLDGTGVKIAVLDTGIDDSHPDLAGRVVAEKNFTPASGSRDRHGHGTHVASIAAGTGKKDARFKGVAPGAELINAKVLDDSGNGEDSGIVAGIDWAVAQGATVLNLSLGGTDTPQVDALEAQINKLSAEKGVLFAVAAGNYGPGPKSIDSPGSAEAALTVGAVDDNDKIADFSGVGPRNWDAGLKPDVTAPGVATTAASLANAPGQSPAGYISMDGTSMATPHAAGAAALLKQKNPGWTGAQLKSVLMGSAKGGAYSVFQQGAGRIAVDQAIDQTVVTEQPNVSLGTQQWPHNDDRPVTKQVTYHNSGDADITLDLSLATPTGADGRPAPAGFFSLGTRQITVPKGGSASVDLTADTTLGGTVNGSYSTTVVASGGGRTVRTPATVDREIESYSVTFKGIGRDGASSGAWQAEIEGLTELAGGYWNAPDLSSGSTTLRLPRGTYAFSADAYVDPADPGKGGDLIDNPKLTVNGDTTVTLDGRTTKPVSVKVPDSQAKQTAAGMTYTLELPDGSLISRGYGFDSFDNVRTAYQGPRYTDGSLSQSWYSKFERGTSEFNTLSGGPVQVLGNGYSKTFATKDLALVKAGLGASVPGKQGALLAYGELPDYSSNDSSVFSVQPAASVRDVWLSTGDGALWDLAGGQYKGMDPEGFPLFEAVYGAGYPRRYAAGATYTENFNVGVHGPLVNVYSGLEREANDLFPTVMLVSDGAGHPTGQADYTTGITSLYRNGTLLGVQKLPADETMWRVPSASATYTLATTVNRSPSVARTSTRIDASWTFTSIRGKGITKLPVSTVRFTPALALDSTAPAGRALSVPLVVQGAAAGSNLKSLIVQVSYDNAKTWKTVPVKSGKATVTSPAKGKGVTLRAIVTDKKNNKSSVIVHNAWLGK
ncbi:S8 family peptidase [Streptomyces qinzhouensis]|uniref:S8 family serine peptidase n=1 Tax=Streptomyces qinzhouensis TaxID=2599401 RepID=A0A5B8JN30_9ACTN|nr:S8 family serine peptidase [Streptomyces qinzhouensis]QDY79013.1 S8 family serine peptidase [Streptomyces qinzhouensis]